MTGDDDIAALVAAADRARRRRLEAVLAAIDGDGRPAGDGDLVRRAITYVDDRDF